MILGHQGFLTSGYQDAKTSIRIDFLASLFHDGLSSRFIHSVLVQFCSRCQLRDRTFASSDWPANKWERGVIFDPFLSPRNMICFGAQQAVFSVTRNRFRNRKQLARKGVENSSEVVAFYRAPRVPRPISWRPSDPRHFHSKLAPQSSVFAHYRTQKRGKSRWIYPVKKA